MTLKEMLQVLKEIRDGKDGQPIPYNIIVHAIKPLVDRCGLNAAIYLLEHIEEED